MNAKLKHRVMSLLMVLLLSLLPVVLKAAAAAGYDLSWWSADSGGGTSIYRGFTLLGLAGQPDAGLMEGGGYSLAGGWLGGGAAPPLPPTLPVFLPLLVR